MLFVKFLKEYFKKSKIAMYLYDAMQTPDSKDFVSRYKDCFDVFLTFNKYDAIEHGIEYYGPVNEAGIIEPKGEGEESDVFYSGGAGWARYDLIIETFKWLSDHGKKCIFFIPVSNEVKKDYFERLSNLLGISRPYEEDSVLFEYKGSKFYFNRYIPYAWALSYILKTKVMLEIIILPAGRASCTNRLAQAMAYEKKLITNSTITKEEIYYNEYNISIFEKAEDIDLTFFNTEFKKTGKNFSCGYLLKYMEYRAFGNIYDPLTKEYVKMDTEFLPVKES